MAVSAITEKLNGLEFYRQKNIKSPLEAIIRVVVFEKLLELETNFESIVHYDTEIARLKQERDKYYSLCSGLYEDLRQEIITKDEFERLHSEFKRKASEFEEAQKKQETMIKELFKDGVISAGRLKMMQDCSELKEIDRSAGNV